MNEMDWYDEDMEELAKAMLEAKEAFDAHFDDQNLDGAYWELELKGFTLDSDFERWRSIDMNFRANENKEDKDDKNSHGC